MPEEINVDTDEVRNVARRRLSPTADGTRAIADALGPGVGSGLGGSGAGQALAAREAATTRVMSETVRALADDTDTDVTSLDSGMKAWDKADETSARSTQAHEQALPTLTRTSAPAVYESERDQEGEDLQDQIDPETDQLDEGDLGGGTDAGTGDQSADPRSAGTGY